MAFEATWYFSQISEKLVDVIEDELRDYEDDMMKSLVGNSNQNQKGDLNSSIRNSDNTWISSEHWVSGIIWYYVAKANRENFLYDIDSIDSESLQFTRYGPGEFYSWHKDEGISGLIKPKAVNRKDMDGLITNHLQTNCQKVRKLSVSLLLSNPEEFEGGNLEFVGEDGKNFVAPRIRGSVCVFDSRTTHRVQPVTKGIRKSIVAWIIGPRWK
jgi:Rps23 Pro-64 3,4-dihydroxylase Tpa1-like proline 4-hydroxylase